MTPPSAIASRKIHANAGPEPESAVHASKCFSSRKRQRPMEEKMLRMILRSRSPSLDSGSVLTTVMPSLILHGVFGIARTTLVPSSTIAVSCLIVTPARMLMSSFPLRASLSPGSFRIACASWGLQLKAKICEMGSVQVR